MAGRSVAGALVLACAVCAGLVAASCLSRRGGDTSPEENPCATCHGDRSRRGSRLVQSAPPSDLKGNTETKFPGVGAHQVHLQPGETHGAIACAECHRIPEHTDDPGHADTARPAEVEFGDLARQDTEDAHYDPATRRCSAYCHGVAEPLWTKVRNSEQACGTCHGLPPPPPHVQSERCSACHAEVIDEDGTITRPNLHVDGSVQVSDIGCSACHGDRDSAAPPPDTRGRTDPMLTSVGLHEHHLSGGNASRPVECSECHPVPDTVQDDGHIDGAVQVDLSGVATRHEQSPSYDAASATCASSWCHSLSSETAEPASWTVTPSGSCSACHGMPPAAPHPQADNCNSCHPAVAGAENNQIQEPSLHVNGTVEVNVPMACDGCHGDGTDPFFNVAPPPDIAGNTQTSIAGVGAHRAHLEATRARPLQCRECHRIPTETLGPGHVDSPLPAEIEFADGPARAFGADPNYQSGTCVNTFCHGDSFVGAPVSGGRHTQPVWTVVDGSQITCTGCHGLPPPLPHPQQGVEPCGQCHQDFDSNNVPIRPERHVDGVVTFFIRD